MDNSWYDGIAQGVREQARLDDEGGTWVLFLDEERRTMNAMALPHEELGPIDYDGLAEVVEAVARSELIDLVVVGEQSWWAASVVDL